MRTRSYIKREINVSEQEKALLSAREKKDVRYNYHVGEGSRVDQEQPRYRIPEK